ncbi:MAG TPA: radical SAM family heme chaperone HemW [Balneolaceae bacterium]|nr:radical SAM family heme chaperone HemW [Balneolaceae bacterium]
MSGLYIHIPFCKQACSYCDFYFVTRTSERDHFVERLIQEIRDYQGTKYVREPVKTVYFGGGTPSLLAPMQVERILSAIEDVFPVDTDEITLEMNPDDVSADFLSALKEIGITRASMGVQTFQPELLEFMHRAHSREEALQCIELLGQTSFDSYTVDLIYGNPGQSLEQLDEDVKTLLQFDPPHISAYSLTIEPQTRLGKQVELGRIVPPEDDKVARHFDLINERFQEQGIRRYEVSNYSKPGREALHNSSYWEHENYLGFGPGAHSFWWDDEAIRWENEADLRNYLKAESNPRKEKLTLLQLAEERLMMGLRTKKGVGLGELTGKYDYRLNERQHEYLNRREDEEKLQANNRICLTDKGIKIADAIILDLVTLH